MDDVWFWVTTAKRIRPGSCVNPVQAETPRTFVQAAVLLFRMAQGELLLESAPDTASAVVPGFSLRENYLSPDEEAELLNLVEDGPWQADWRRRIQQFGLGYAGEIGGKPSWVRDFPQWLAKLGERVARDAGFERLPENCVINEYIPPLGIAPHRDYPAFGPTIACVSLGSDVILDLIKPDRSVRVPILIPARSLWVMTGEARTKWLHGIAPRLNDVVAGQRRRRGRRVSITFRTAKDAGALLRSK
jgi:alkylated DNA repair dioxygenase AlkB